VICAIRCCAVHRTDSRFERLCRITSQVPEHGNGSKMHVAVTPIVRIQGPVPALTIGPSQAILIRHSAGAICAIVAFSKRPFVVTCSIDQSSKFRSADERDTLEVSVVRVFRRAGAIVVAYAMMLGTAYGDLNWINLRASLWSAAESTGIILFMVSTASVVGWLLAIGRFPGLVVDAVGMFGDSYAVVILVIIAVLLLIGMILDGMAAMIILVPVLYPVATQLGLDQIQFAMVIILCTMIGAITPPVGLLLYVSCQVSGVPPRAIGWSIWPFVGIMVLVTVCVAFIPHLSLWLPDVIF